MIDATFVYAADFTAAKAISAMIADFKLRNQKLIFYNLKPSVVNIFDGINTKLVLCYNIVALNHELNYNSNSKTEENSQGSSYSSTLQI